MLKKVDETERVGRKDVREKKKRGRRKGEMKGRERGGEEKIRKKDV